MWSYHGTITAICNGTCKWRKTIDASTSTLKKSWRNVEEGREHTLSGNYICGSCEQLREILLKATESPIGHVGLFKDESVGVTCTAKITAQEIMPCFDGVINITCTNCKTSPGEIHGPNLCVTYNDDISRKNSRGQNRKYKISSPDPYVCHCGIYEPLWYVDTLPEGPLSNFENNTNPEWISCEINLVVKYVVDNSKKHTVISDLIQRIKKKSLDICDISSRDFEEIVSELFRKQGFEVTLGPGPSRKDGGKDVVAFHKNIMGIETRYFIECKHPDEPGNKIGVDVVRQAYGVHSAKNGPNKFIIVTTSKFTCGAHDFAKNLSRSKWEIELKDIDDVRHWIDNYRA